MYSPYVDAFIVIASLTIKQEAVASLSLLYFPDVHVYSPLGPDISMGNGLVSLSQASITLALSSLHV